MQRSAFHLLALCFTVVIGLFWFAATPAQAQTSDAPHSLRIDVRGFSQAQVTVDGIRVFAGYLLPNEWRQWQGEAITLTIGSTASVLVTLDLNTVREITATAQSVTLSWPEADQLPPATSLDEAIDRNPGEVIAEETREMTRAPALYVVRSGDTLAELAEHFQIDLESLIQTNQIGNPNQIYAGSRLIIPGSDGTLPDPQRAPTIGASDDTVLLSPGRGSVVDRLTVESRQTSPTSPYHQTTWLTYYGRPQVPIMGILGEHEIEALAALLQQQVATYDAANGDELAVQGAFHLVYGMATKAPGADASHLAFLTDEVVERYIEAAQAAQLAVILDIQIGALSPVDALAYGLPWLTYDNVHLALDPEFAMVHPGQVWPGDPIGFVTAAQINEAQASMQAYLVENQLAGERILLLHQFLDQMIVNKGDLDWRYERIALTISADGWGGPWGKISKYNAFIDEQIHFSAFKLFYHWDVPLMTPREALGIDGFGEQGYIEVTPNLIIYQ